MPKNEMNELLEQLYRQAQMQFGPAIKSRWLYDRDGCPGCGCEIDAFKFKKKKRLSLNAFIYREHGVLIAYFLCGKCARYIFRESEKNPYTRTELHIEIEKNLKAAYVRHLGH
jgi:hypothetical protein